MTRYTYPHTIENGAGERITFARQGAGPAGDRLEGENVDVAFLTTRFRSEYAVLEIPPAVQRIVFPVFVAVGRLLGRYARYADAPPPVPR